MTFRNRIEAAVLLAQRLTQYRGHNPLVLAIPRGAVPMGRIMATALGGELDVMLVHKLGAPGNAEFAIGAMDESGWTYIADMAAVAGADAAYIEAEKSMQFEALRRRRLAYTPVRPPIDPVGRVVILVDDGLATGSSMIAAVHALRRLSPRKIIVAVPVSPPETLKKVAALADAALCLMTPAHFIAVSQFYQEFDQVSDAEVIALLRAPLGEPHLPVAGSLQ